MNSYNERAIIWTEPAVDADSGQWQCLADNLNQRTKYHLAKSELVSICEEDRFTARVTLSRDYVSEYGARRCWWLLREMVTEEPVLVKPHVQGWLDDALERPWPGQTGQGWDDDDLGDLGWGRLDYIS